jgi:hypothetical protein
LSLPPQTPESKGKSFGEELKEELATIPRIQPNQKTLVSRVGKKNRNHPIEIKNVRHDRFAYNQYVERKSVLDQIYDDSLISRSPFKGILRLVLLAAFTYSLNNILLRHYQKGKLLFDWDYLGTLQTQILYGLCFWLFCHLWTYWYVTLASNPLL